MSWLFSRALVAEYSAATCWDGAPSAPLSVMPTPHRFSRNGRMMEPCQLSRFGLMCAVLTERTGEALLTWFRADSHARTYRLPGQALAWRERVPGSGNRCGGSLARYDHQSSSWKTAQLSLLEDSAEFSATWPNWGSMRNGECWEQVTLAPHIAASGSGLWPTPTVHGNHNKPGTSKNAGWGLSSAVKLWPTPTAMSGSGGAALCKWGGSGSRKAMRKLVTPQELNGPLNPAWVEWLMGWPIGWTDLEPLAMARFREWQRQHSTTWLEGIEGAA